MRNKRQLVIKSVHLEGPPQNYSPIILLSKQLPGLRLCKHARRGWPSCCGQFDLYGNKLRIKPRLLSPDGYACTFEYDYLERTLD